MGAILISRRAALAGAAWAAAAAGARAQADEASARVERMFARLGGRARWAGARSLFVRYRQFYAGSAARAVEERAWRDLAEPNERLEWSWISGDGAARTRARGFADGAVWSRNEAGEVGLADAAETADFLGFWPRDFYTMLGRLARADPALRLSHVAAHRIEVADAAGAGLGWWEIDQHGEMLRWGARFNAEEELAYLYGPYRSFGPIAFPGWGAATDAGLRFEYMEVRVSERPLPEAVRAARAAPPPADLGLL